MSSQGDVAALQGTWEQVAFEIDGAAVAQNPYDAAGTLTTFTGHRFTVHTRDGVTLLEGNFALDAVRNPKTIDWTDTMGADAGKTLPAIYRLQDDRFLFVAADPGMPRPSAFRTIQGQTMREFVRCS